MTSLAGTNNGTDTGTSHTVNLPTPISSGQLLLAFFCVDSVETTTWPTGGDAWTKIVDDVGSQQTTAVAYRIADGTEGGSIEVTTPGSEISNHVTHRYTNWHGTTPPEASSATGSNSSPNPPSVTASWGSEDNFFIAGCGYNDGRTTVSTYPTNYASNQHNEQDGAAGGTGVGIATDEVASDNQDPGTYSLSSSEAWTAFTVVIRPAAAAAGGATPIPDHAGLFRRRQAIKTY